MVHRRRRSVPAATLLALSVLAWASGPRAAPAEGPDAGTPGASRSEAASPPRGLDHQPPAGPQANQGEPSGAPPDGTATATESGGLFEQSSSAAATGEPGNDQGKDPGKDRTQE